MDELEDAMLRAVSQKQTRYHSTYMRFLTEANNKMGAERGRKRGLLNG
jgi:hypothetical protein